MSQEIAVVGAPDFTTGFRLAGVRKFHNVDGDDVEALEDAVREVARDEDVGIVVMHDEDVAKLSREPRSIVDTSIEPTFVTLGGGAGSGGLREQIKRAIGIDLMDED
ncbi:V-type ATP synthase subunit F [Halorubellus sp. PRR65]|uniref:V-type ATP synthase subunit F n=1 Tax=Halorubellus sp. PRR65 TaxID=3098148 RepID=UPI002B25CF00|nr:V-type ATP synthase subunit F [Halorubellus sp. PRR65]